MIKIKLKICFGCNKPKKIWKNISGKKYCQGCAASAGVASDASKPKAKPPGKPLPGVSSKQAKLDTLYSAARIIFLSTHPLCQANLPGCTQKATDVHHKSGRGEFYLDTTTWFASCRHCHTWIGDHPTEAITLGFSNLRLETKDDGNKKGNTDTRQA